MLNFSGWVDVSWAQNVASSSKTNNENTFNVKVMDISDPDVQAAMLEAEKRGKNENNRSLHHTTLDNALKQVVLSFGKKSSETDAKTDLKTTKCDTISKSQTNKTNIPDETNNSEPQNSRIDLANLQFLMAVEDLLDSSSSDLVASALAEAASMRVDQLRLATQSFRSTLLESSKGRPTPTAQGSRESQSPPTEPSVPLHGESSLRVEDISSKENGKNNNSKDIVIAVSKQSKSSSDEIGTLNTDKATPPSILSESEIESLLSGEECMNQIKKITSSMSEVLGSMNIQSNDDNSNNDEGFTPFEPVSVLNDDYDESQTENSLSVAENNFLNDNHSVLEPDDIYDDCCESDDEDDDDDDDEEQAETHLVVRKLDANSEDHISVRYELLSSDQDGNTDSIKNYINTKSGDSSNGVTIVNLHGTDNSDKIESIDSYSTIKDSDNKTKIKESESPQISPNSLIDLLVSNDNNGKTSTDESSDKISTLIEDIMSSDHSESKDFIGSLLGIIPSKQLDEDSLQELGINIHLTPNVEIVETAESNKDTETVEFHSHIKTDVACEDLNVDRNNEKNENDLDKEISNLDVVDITMPTFTETAESSNVQKDDANEDNLFTLQEILQVNQSSPNTKTEGKSEKGKIGSETIISDENEESNKQSALLEEKTVGDVLKLMPKEDLER